MILVTTKNYRRHYKVFRLVLQPTVWTYEHCLFLSRLLATMLTFVAAVFMLATAHSLPNDITEEFARMSREITSKHFSKSKRVAIVTDYNDNIMRYIYPKDISVLQIHLPFDITRDSKAQSTGTKTSE
jgi:hypothetical protein